MLEPIELKIPIDNKSNTYWKVLRVATSLCDWKS